MTEKTAVKLLLIEDSPTDAILFRELIGGVSEINFDLHHCETLGSGKEKLSQEDFDAVVLDLNLPDSVGLATFNSVRNMQPEIAVVILTGNDDRAVSNLALQAGADNYLLKDTTNGDRIAVAILSAIRNRSRGYHSFTPPLRTVNNFENA